MKLRVFFKISLEHRNKDLHKNIVQIRQLLFPLSTLHEIRILISGNFSWLPTLVHARHRFFEFWEIAISKRTEAPR